MRHVHRLEPNLLCLELFIQSIIIIVFLLMIIFLANGTFYIEEAFSETVSDWFSSPIANYNYYYACLHQKDTSKSIKSIKLRKFCILRLNSFILILWFRLHFLEYRLRVRWMSYVVPKIKHYDIIAQEETMRILSFMCFTRHISSPHLTLSHLILYLYI